MKVARRQLAASIRSAAHIVDREAIASFISDEATEVGLNPFPHTTAGAQGHIWAGHSFDFRASQVEALGLACLLKALDSLAGDEPLAQEIFRAGPYRAYVYHPGDGCKIVGAVVYGGAGMALPVPKTMPQRRPVRRARRAHPQQLDLFARLACGIERTG